jgi:hypothetical protein
MYAEGCQLGKSGQRSKAIDVEIVDSDARQLDSTAARDRVVRRSRRSAYMVI